MHRRRRGSFDNLGEQRCVPQTGNGYLPSLLPWGHWLGSLSVGLWTSAESAWRRWRLIDLFEVSQQSPPGLLVSVDGWSMTTQAEDRDAEPPLPCGDTRGPDEHASRALCHELAATPALLKGGCCCQSSARLAAGIPGTSLFRFASLCTV